MSKLITLEQGLEFLARFLGGKVTCAQAGKALERIDEIIELIKYGVVKTTKGKVVHIPDGISPKLLVRLFDAVRLGKINLNSLLNPLAPYRAIDGLLVIGPAEWEKAMTGLNGENPLKLRADWVPDVPLPEEWTPELFQKLVMLCKTRDWSCTPVLQLELPDVADKPASLINFYNWWGVAHDGCGPGSIRKDLDYSNWFIKEQIKDWPVLSTTKTARWRIGYVDFPALTTKKNWENQQKAAKEHGLIVSSAVSDALMMLLLAINYQKFRTSTWARTSTIYGGRPLNVNFGGDSLFVNGDWNPENAYADLGLAVEGVPLTLGS